MIAAVGEVELLAAHYGLTVDGAGVHQHAALKGEEIASHTGTLQCDIRPNAVDIPEHVVPFHAARQSDTGGILKGERPIDMVVS
jgi:hypothetical protein